MSEFFNRIRQAFGKRHAGQSEPATTAADDAITFSPDAKQILEEAFAPAVRRVNIRDRIGPEAARGQFHRYEMFRNPDTFRLWLRTQKPDWIGVNIANATYKQGVNVATSAWLAGYKPEGAAGMLLEVDPNIVDAAEAYPPAHTGSPQWADRHPEVQPVMVAATTTELLPDLEGKADMALAVAPAPMFKDVIVREGFRMLKPGGELVAILDPIVTKHEGDRIDPALVDELIAACPAGSDIRVNGQPYAPGDPVPHLSVFDYKMERDYPRTAYINDNANYDHPVLVFRARKPV